MTIPLPPALARVPPSASLYPVAAAHRVPLLDVLRGLALFGVLVANLNGWFNGSSFLPAAEARALQETGIQFPFLAVSRLFVEYKFIAIFSMLFGIGFSMQLLKPEARGRALPATYARRLLVLFVIGVLHAVLVWYGDILHMYAIVGLALLAARGLRTRTTLIVGIGLLVIAGTLEFASQADALLAWAQATRLFPWLPQRRFGLWALEAFRDGGLREMVATNLAVYVRYMYSDPATYAYRFCLISGLFFVGFAIGRSGVVLDVPSHRRPLRRVVRWGFVIALLTKLASFAGWSSTEPFARLAAEIVNVVSNCSLGLVYMAAVALLFERPAWRRGLLVLAPVGRMALTNYLVQSLLAVVLFYGLGLIGRVGPAGCWSLAAVVFSAQLAASHAWLGRFSYGPAEWVWRRLTYGRWPSQAAVPRGLLRRCLRWTAVLLVAGTTLAASYTARSLSRSTPGVYRSAAAPWSMKSPDPSSAATEVIFYTSLRPSNWDVFLYRNLGAPPEQLTHDPAPDYNATLSPGGGWVVFTSERSGNADLYAVNLQHPDQPIPLTRNVAFDDAATVSPDGRTIAFVSTRQGTPDIFLMPFDPQRPDAEREARRLTDDPAGEFNPRFAPDGRTIAFTSNRDLLWRWHPLRLIDRQGVQTRVYTVGVDGSGLRRITAGIGLSGRPAWSADGRTLYYYRATSETELAVRAVGADGRGDRRLTADSMAALTPAVLPDASILFIRPGQAPRFSSPVLERAGSLHRMRPDGSGIERVGSAAETRKYFAPNCDPRSGLVVAHGNGALEGLPLLAEGMPLSWPSTRHVVTLPDRTVELRALRAFFPSYSPALQRGVGVSWLFEEVGKPPGPAPLVTFDGAASRATPLWQPPHGFAWGPVVSRDGRWILFNQGPRFGSPKENVDIWRIRADGTEPINLTADSPANDAFPDLSADGRRVVFRSGRTGDSEIYVMDIEGSDVRRISESAGADTMPAISPDGRRVVYTTERTGFGMKLWIQSVGDPLDRGRQLEPARAHLFGLDMHPRFSPDGRWVVFTSDRAGFRDEWYLSSGPQPYGDLFAFPVDGSGPAIQLTNDKWEDGLPFWASLH